MPSELGMQDCLISKPFTIIFNIIERIVYITLLIIVMMF